MKKFILITVLIFISVFAYSQRWRSYYEVADKTIDFDRPMPANSVVLEIDSNMFYRLTAKFLSTQDMADVFTSGNYKTVAGGGAITDSAFWSRNGNYVWNETIGDSVGIGIAVLEAKLDVNGNVLIRNDLKVRNIDMEGTGVSGGWIFDTNNSMSSISGVEASMLQENDTLFMWFRRTISPGKELFLTYSTNDTYSNWSTPQQLTGAAAVGWFPDVFKIGSTYFMTFSEDVAGNPGDIYLLFSTDKLDWKTSNSGNPILTHSATPTSNIYSLFNASIAIVGNTWHFVVETKTSTSEFQLMYSYADGSDTANINFNINISANPIVLNAGNMQLKHISASSSLMLIHGNISNGYWFTDGKYALLSDDLSLSASWKTPDHFPRVFNKEIHVADFYIVNITGESYFSLMMFNYDQSGGYDKLFQGYSSLTIEQLYDFISGQLILNGGIYSNRQIAGSELLINGSADIFGKITGEALNTGQGDNELYAMNQDVESTDDVTFNSATLTTASTELGSDIVNFSELQNSLVKVFYNFDGYNDKITVADNADIDFGTSDFSVVIKVVFLKLDINQGILGKRIGFKDKQSDFFLDGATNKFFVLIGDGGLGTTLTSNEIAINTKYTFTYSRISGVGYLYQNGIQVDTDAQNLNVTNATDLTIGWTAGTLYGNVNISQVFLFNRALTLAEAKEVSLWDSDNPPMWFSDIGANNDEKMPNVVDRDFSGASAWANVDLGGTYDETGDLTITATVAAQYCTCPVASAPTSIGKNYKMTFDVANIVETWTIKSFDGTQTIGTISANGTQTALEWEATTIGGYRMVAVATTSSADFDNFTLTQIGCVGNWNGSGMGTNTWCDASGNDLFGTASGATYTNIPNNDIETVRQDGITDDTQILTSSNVVPAGYILKYVIGTETAGNTCILDLGTAASGTQAFNQETFTANTITTVVINKVFSMTDDKALYLSDDGVGTWNGASLDCVFVIQKIQ